MKPVEEDRLAGLTEYLKAHYEESVFDQVQKNKNQLWTLHVHGGSIETGLVVENRKYDILFVPEGGKEEELPKLHVKFLYPADSKEAVSKLLKVDQRIEAMKLEPIKRPAKRHHIKNKTLWPLMRSREVLFFTMLEGEILRGLVTGFSRYEIVLSLKGGIPVHLLRHAVFDVRDKRGRCYLKSAVERK